MYHQTALGYHGSGHYPGGYTSEGTVLSSGVEGAEACKEAHANQQTAASEVQVVSCLETV